MPQLSSPLARFADHLLGGALEEKLRNWRADGLSWDDVAKALWAETDKQVSITGPGVQAWADRLGIEPAQSQQAAS